MYRVWHLSTMKYEYIVFGVFLFSFVMSYIVKALVCFCLMKIPFFLTSSLEDHDAEERFNDMIAP